MTVRQSVVRPTFLLENNVFVSFFDNNFEEMTTINWFLLTIRLFALSFCEVISNFHLFVVKKMMDLAKEGDEATIYTWINRKEIIPKVFGDLLQRYNNVNDCYTTVYKLPPRKFDSAQMGVVEFKGNELPQLLLTDEQLRELASNQMKKQESRNIPWKGTPV